MNKGDVVTLTATVTRIVKGGFVDVDILGTQQEGGVRVKQENVREKGLVMEGVWKWIVGNVKKLR